jgi:hypothetical protein
MTGKMHSTLEYTYIKHAFLATGHDERDNKPSGSIKSENILMSRRATTAQRRF